MDYIFYWEKDDEYETLKTVGDEHSDLYDTCSVTTITKIETTTHNFDIVEKIKSEIDKDGKCVDYYHIVNHWIVKDRTEQHEYSISLTEDALLEEDTYIDERLSAVEDAICELDEMLNGGE